MYILQFCTVIFFLGFIYAAYTNPCLSQSSCRCVLSNNSVIDLSTVGSPEFVRFYAVSFNTSCSTMELYSYNPCFAFDSPDRQTTTKSGNTPCSGASACVKTPGGSDGQFPETHAIGLQNSAVFAKDDKNIMINYTVPNLQSGSLQVILECSESHGDHHILSINTPECETKGTPIVMTLTSKCACPDGCPTANPTPSSPTGLSTGSKLLIAFFTILIAYLLIGVVWNYCNGAHGSELVPNIEFWNDLPTLIMEGVTFTCSCCGRSYGEV